MNKSKNVITKLCLSFLLLGIFFLLSSKTVHAAPTYCTIDSGNCYVDGVGGLDTNNGKTTTTAWKTIQQAANTVGAGDTVNVKGGITYAETVTPANSGSSGNYITYQAWNGTGMPVVTKSGANCFDVSKIYIKLSKFIITGCVMGINDPGYGYLFITNSIFYNNSRSAIEVMGSNFSIYNNTITKNGSGNGGVIVNVTSSGGSIIENNIVTNNIGIGIGKDVSFFSFTNDYNLVFNNSGLAGAPDWGTDYMINVVPGVHDVNSDPLFTNAAGGDFTLQTTSPAKNAGVDLSGSGVTTDIAGVARPQGSGYDIGAYEYYDIPVTLTSVPASSSNVSSPSFTGTASTIGAATISSISYSVDGGGWSTAGVSGTTSFAITIPHVDDGTHTVRVRATDSYGNSSDSSLMGISTFYINTITTKGPPVCGNLITSATPNLFEIRTNKTTATLFFTPPIPPYSSFYIAYSGKPDSTQYGVEYNQSYSGNGGVLNYTINMLSPNTRYYFTIRAGNGCSTGSWGNTLTAVTTTGTLQRTYYKNFPIVINNLLPKK